MYCYGYICYREFLFVFQHNTQTELLKPCIDTVKELLECGDDDLERDANNIITAVAGNMELAGDQTDAILDRYFSGSKPSLIGLQINFDIHEKPF